LLAKTYIFFYKKHVDAEETTNDHNVDSQEQIWQPTSNENMADYCQLLCKVWGNFMKL
jgi:hypothetical protein